MPLILTPVYMFGSFKWKIFIKIIILQVLTYILVKLAVYIFYEKVYIRPVIVWWTPFMPKEMRKINCQHEYECLVLSRYENSPQDLVKAYLFYGSQIKNDDFPLPRSKDVLWAIYHEESPKNYAPFLHKEVQALFNITATFSRFSDFPLTLNYLDNINLLTDKNFFRSVEVKNLLLKNFAPVLYVQSNCDTPIGRDGIVKELMQYINVDSYGHCLNNKNLPDELLSVDRLDIYNNKYIDFVSKYKFIIAIENAICEDYITEKLWRPLIAGSVPIYLGSDQVEDWLPNNSSTILVKDFPNISSLANFIAKVNDNNTLYNALLEHKINGKITNNFLKNNIILDSSNSHHSITNFECFICKTIHEMIRETNKNPQKQRKQNIYKCDRPSGKMNTWDQHWDIGKCQAKALKFFLDKNVPYSSDEFDAQWKLFWNQGNC
ncbi:alpha-(1,3)-fucosyltransferase 10 [Cylas formicarius]|uniref:alpha-(1,3)-fucosyltransferase 10 n=1 Tax=Cylas formicarius TaxID=197179 RepID=UPI00295839CA|nr:alpha-(1,3)-fucosyltransferase 10 [Cylas formicarius]